MGVISYEIEITSSLSPAKLFKAFVLDANTLVPKVLPQAIKCIENIEGDGGAGTIQLITFVEGSPISSVKHRVEELDNDNFTYKYCTVDADDSNFLKIEASGDGGSVCKYIKTGTKDDANINLEDIKAAKEQTIGMFKAVEAYVLANPEY